MNNKKQIKSIMTLIIGVTLVWVFALGFTACGDDNGEQRSDRTGVQINLTFGDNSYTATVKGKQLTDTEWSGASAKVENSINTLYNGYGALIKFRLDSVFNGNDVEIILENTFEYSKYKVIGNDDEEIVKILYLNVGHTLTIDDLEEIAIAMHLGNDAIQ